MSFKWPAAWIAEHFKRFEEEATGRYLTSSDILDNIGTVFLAAKEDYDGGYLVSVRSLVQAELFDSELEQACELLDKGYPTASAVIAGTVLETTLRELCARNGVAAAALDRMNTDLAKKGVYSLNWCKRITALAGIRNSAAHGKQDEFTQGDIKSMITEIERFLAEHLQ